MAEEPRPLMYNIGVEGDRFSPHRKNADCAAAGCVPVTPQPDDTRDAARFRWLIAHSTYVFHCWRLPFLYGNDISFEVAIDRAMGADAQALQQEPLL